MPITVSKFLDVANGLQPGQFSVGERCSIASLNDIDPTYKQLMDEPVTAVVAVMGGEERPNLTPMWFDYADEKILVNVAAHRKKTNWIRKNPRLTILLMNPKNPYHWISFKATVINEIHEDDPEKGHRATEHVNKIWTKYTGQEPPYGLRDPSIDERRVLFECRVDHIATFGKP